MATTLLRLPAVLQRTGFGRSSLYALIRTGDFPAPISLGARAVAWTSDDVDGWISGRIQQSHQLRSSGSANASVQTATNGPLVEATAPQGRR